MQTFKKRSVKETCTTLNPQLLNRESSPLHCSFTHSVTYSNTMGKAHKTSHFYECLKYFKPVFPSKCYRQDTFAAVRNFILNGYHKHTAYLSNNWERQNE